MKSVILTIISLLLLSYPAISQDTNFTPEEFVKKYFKVVLKTDDTFYMGFLFVDDSRFIIGDRTHCRVFVYSKPDGKKIIDIGEEGEGPGEIKGFIYDIKTSGEQINITSQSRLSIFSKEGKLVKEYKTNYSLGQFIPVNDHFIALEDRFNRKNARTISQVYVLLDSDLTIQKDLYTIDYQMPVTVDKNKEPMVYFPHQRKGVLYKDRFYIGHTDRGFYIAVFDLAGNKVREIDKKYEKIKVTGSMKDNILKTHFYRSNDQKFINQKEPIFEEYIPAFLNFFVDHDRIYVFHYEKPGDKGWTDLTVLDLNGNLLATKKIFMDSMIGLIEIESYINFNNGKLYFLLGLEEESRIAEFDIDAVISQR